METHKKNTTMKNRMEMSRKLGRRACTEQRTREGIRKSWGGGGNTRRRVETLGEYAKDVMRNDQGRAPGQVWGNARGNIGGNVRGLNAT